MFYTTLYLNSPFDLFRTVSSDPDCDDEDDEGGEELVDVTTPLVPLDTLLRLSPLESTSLLDPILVVGGCGGGGGGGIRLAASSAFQWRSGSSLGSAPAAGVDDDPLGRGNSLEDPVGEDKSSSPVQRSWLSLAHLRKDSASWLTWIIWLRML